MAQILRPDSDLTRTNLASGTWASIDETTPNNADYVQTNNYVESTSTRYEASLSNPALNPTNANVILRVRVAGFGVGKKANFFIRDGGTTVGFYGPGALPNGVITTYSQAITLSPAPSSWSDIRLFTTFTDDEDPPNLGYVRIYWAELEVADGFAGYTMTADGGTFSLTGGDASLKVGRVLAAEGAVYTLETGDAAFITGKGFLAEGVEYTLTGGDVQFRAARVLTATGGTYSLTGGDASFRKDYFIMAEGTSYSLTGGDVTFYIRERNGWDVPKYPSVSWSQAGGGSGEWTELIPSDVDWTLQ